MEAMEGRLALVVCVMVLLGLAAVGECIKFLVKRISILTLSLLFVVVVVVVVVVLFIVINSLLMI